MVILEWGSILSWDLIKRTRKKILPLIFLALIFPLHQYVLIAQQIDSVKLQMESKYLYSDHPLPESFYHSLEVTLIDQNGNTVPEGTAFAFSVRNGFATGTSFFGADISDENFGGGTFYFRTTGNTTTIQYRPTARPRPFHRVKSAYPDSSESALWRLHDGRNELHEYRGQTLFKSASFTNPDDVSTVFEGDDIPLTSDSQRPVLVAMDKATIVARGRYGDRYIFAADGLKPYETKMVISARDSRDRPIPEGAPVTISLQFGYIRDSNLIEADTSTTNGWFSASAGINFYRAGGGEFVVPSGPNGTIETTYEAPKMTPPPFTAWHNTFDEILFEGLSRQKALEFYSSVEFTASDNLERSGFAIVESVGGYGFYTAEFDSSQSTLPVVIGLDEVTYTTTSKQGDEFVFTSARIAEKATLEIEAKDMLGRPAPANTPFVVILNPAFNQNSAVQWGGYLTGPGVFKYGAAAFNNRGIYIRLQKEGYSKLTYHAQPYDLPRVKPGFEVERRRGLELFATPAYFGCGGFGRCQDDSLDPIWFTEINNIGSLRIQVSDESTVPTLIGPQTAVASFKPGSLGPFRIFSKVEGRLTDYRGLPVPAGTNINVEVSRGGIPVTNRRTIFTGSGGRFTLPYYSPTRKLSHTSSTDELKINLPFNGVPFGESVITLNGPALNGGDFALGRFLLGFSVKKFISDLNPLKIYGSLKKFNSDVQNLGESYKTLLNKTYEGTATQQDFQRYKDSFKDMSGSMLELIQNVPGTSLTGPPIQGGRVGALFRSISSNGVRKTIINTAREELIDAPLQQAVTNFFQTEANRALLEQPNKANKRNHQNSVAQNFGESDFVFNAGNIKISSPLFTLADSTQGYELYGLKLHISDVDTHLVNTGKLEVGDVAPILNSILPDEVSDFGKGELPLNSPGIIQITDINPSTFEVDAVIAGMAYPDTRLLAEAAFSKNINANADTLRSNPEFNIRFKDSTFTESHKLFNLKIPPPKPVDDENKRFMLKAYAFSAIDTVDSTLNNINFEKLPTGIIRFNENEQGGIPTIFRWNNTETDWQVVPSSAQNDTALAFEMETTGIYGLGFSDVSFNEPPSFSSIMDTTVFNHEPVTISLNVFDPDRDSLEFGYSTNSDFVSASLKTNPLEITITPDTDWYGDATIEVWATDNIDTSFVRFNYQVAKTTDTDVNDQFSDLPDTFILHQNYPNPFNPSTTIDYEIPEVSDVKLVIYNLLGREVSTLVDQRQAAGRYTVNFDARNLSSGIYLYRLITETKVLTQKMVLIK